jgi:hypothetical protein
LRVSPRISDIMDFARPHLRISHAASVYRRRFVRAAGCSSSYFCLRSSTRFSLCSYELDSKSVLSSNVGLLPKTQAP